MEDILNPEEIKEMRKLGKIAHTFLQKLGKILKPGLATKEIEDSFCAYLDKCRGLESAFLGYSGYPANLCVSINEEVIHGIPQRDKIVKDGDVVSVDLGIKHQGLFVDCAYTYLVGRRVSREVKQLVRVGLRALREGIKKAKVGNTTGDIGFIIQKIAQESGFSVIRSFVGHGVGHGLHCYPEVPNFGSKGEGVLLKEGMALAIEPMFAQGGFEVKSLADGWTVKTKDNSLSCHFEHTVAITRKGPMVIT